MYTCRYTIHHRLHFLDECWEVNYLDCCFDCYVNMLKKQKKTNTHRFLWLIWHDTALRAKLNLLVKLVNNNYLRIKSLFFSFQQIPALSEQCSPVAIVIADTAPYFRLVFWLLLPWDLHPSLSLSLILPAVPLSPHLTIYASL